jgi:hypothetical protein
MSMDCLGDASAPVLSLISNADLVSQSQIAPGGKLLEIDSGYSIGWSRIILD